MEKNPSPTKYSCSPILPEFHPNFRAFRFFFILGGNGGNGGIGIRMKMIKNPVVKLPWYDFLAETAAAVDHVATTKEGSQQMRSSWGRLATPSDPHSVCGDIWMLNQKIGIITPKWMVKIMENPIKMGWFGGTTIFGNTHINISPKYTLDVSLSLSHCFTVFEHSVPKKTFHSSTKNQTLTQWCSRVHDLSLTSTKPKRPQLWLPHAKTSPFSSA